MAPMVAPPGVTGGATTAQEREQTFGATVEIALAGAVRDGVSLTG